MWGENEIKIPKRVVLLVLLLTCSTAFGASVHAAGRHHILFSGDANPARSQLFIAKGDGSGERALFPLTGLDYSPSFSADGQWVVFTSERDGPANIYRVHPD